MGRPNKRKPKTGLETVAAVRPRFKGKGEKRKEHAGNALTRGKRKRRAKKKRVGT